MSEYVSDRISVGGDHSKKVFFPGISSWKIEMFFLFTPKSRFHHEHWGWSDFCLRDKRQLLVWEELGFNYSTNQETVIWSAKHADLRTSNSISVWYGCIKQKSSGWFSIYFNISSIHGPRQDLGDCPNSPSHRGCPAPTQFVLSQKLAKQDELPFAENHVASDRWWTWE